MTPAQIITDLGGPTAVAVALAPAAPGRTLAPNTVVHWGRRGIPPRYWLPIARLAATRKPAITLDLIERSAILSPSSPSEQPRACAAAA